MLASSATDNHPVMKCCCSPDSPVRGGGLGCAGYGPRQEYSWKVGEEKAHRERWWIGICFHFCDKNWVKL